MSDTESEDRPHHQPAEPDVKASPSASRSVSEPVSEPVSELTSALTSEARSGETPSSGRVYAPLSQISDFIHPETTCVHMGASGQRAAIHELVGLLIKEIPEADPNDLVRFFEQREKFYSTTAFDGVALPFVELTQIERPVVALATSLEGVEFSGPDRAPTYLFVAIATPHHKPELITRIFARLTRLFRKYPTLAQTLSELDEPELLRNRFTEIEQRLP